MQPSLTIFAIDEFQSQPLYFIVLKEAGRYILTSVSDPGGSVFKSPLGSG